MFADTALDATLVALDVGFADSASPDDSPLSIAAIRFANLPQLGAGGGSMLREGEAWEAVAVVPPVGPDDTVVQLARFVGTAPVVGYRLEPGLEALRRDGRRFRPVLLDVGELADLLLPGMPPRSLEGLAQALGVGVAGARDTSVQRARLIARIFEALRRQIDDLETETLGEIIRLSLPLDWPLRRVFVEARRQRPPGSVSDPPSLGPPAWLLRNSVASPRPDPLVPNEQRTAIDLDELTRAVSQGGVLSKVLPGFEQRTEQIEMLRAVAGVFDESEHLLVEAGTGTGKSLAYLLPAVHFAVANRRRVVISTNTINLQDQLAEKELPLLRQAVGLDFNYTVLKGRSNYLCLRRWFGLLRSNDPDPDERLLLIRTLIWLRATETGDRSELRLTPREEAIWSRVSAQAEACSPQTCIYNRLGRCFLARARRAAEASHVVVVNHSLLLADLAADSRVLPSYQHLVIDEAHHLESEATDQLGWTLGSREPGARLERLWEGGGRRAAGLVPRALEALERRGGRRAEGEGERLTAELSAAIGALVDELPLVFRRLAAFVSEHGERSETGGTTLRLSGAVRAQPEWSELEIVWDEQNQRWLRLERSLRELLRLLEAGAELDEADDLLGELQVQLRFWQESRARLCDALLEADTSTVSWLLLGRNQEIYVNAAPLHVGDHLRTALFEAKETVVLTSATLTADGSYSYLRERLGLDSARELIVGSPFDYRRSALVYIPEDLPEPASPTYQHAVERTLSALIGALGGRTLVLFTSHSQLRATHRAIRSSLEAQRVTVLAQGVDGTSRAHLLESFRTSQQAALLGTASFWEGVDVVGEALSCVAIARLPFTTPSDPVFQARSECFEDPFREYALPGAILRFRQGFGRLIRSGSDRGVLVVLDRRLKTRSYGRAFLRSLPECAMREGPSGQLPETALEWLDEPQTLLSAAH